MVAQRKTIPKATRSATPRRRAVAAAQPQQTASDSGDGDGDPARELLSLQAMRADARKWLAEIERRIVELEQAG